jgi:hypothetical protein
VFNFFWGSSDGLTVLEYNICMVFFFLVVYGGLFKGPAVFIPKNDSNAGSVFNLVAPGLGPTNKLPFLQGGEVHIIWRYVRSYKPKGLGSSQHKSYAQTETFLYSCMVNKNMGQPKTPAGFAT